MQVVCLNNSLYSAYNEFLASKNMLYYSLSFKNLLEEFLNCKSLYYVAYDSGKIHGILPLMYRGGKFGEVLNSLPFYGSHGGILASNNEAKLKLTESYNNIINNFAALNYISNPFYDNTQGIIYDYKDYRIGQLSYIADSVDISSSAKRNVLKAKRKGVEIVKTKDIDFLYKTHYDNISSIGGIAKEKRFFSILKNHFNNEEYVIYEAIFRGQKIRGQKIAALLVFCFGDVVEYYTPATFVSYRTIQALPLIIYTAMIEMQQKGYKWWNFGGIWSNQDGVYRFKKKFGALIKSMSI